MSSAALATESNATATAVKSAPAQAFIRGAITPAHVAFYKEYGFLVHENAFDPDEIDELNRDTAKICRGEYGAVKGGWVAGTEGIDPAASAGQSDDEVIKKFLCIHFPHKISQTMLKSITHRSFVHVLTNIIGPNVKCMQSMLFVKAAGKPGQAWHQDEFYIPTRDRSLTGGWIAMDDATVENGCLWVIPGSQKQGVLWPQHTHTDRRFDCAGESFQFPYTDDDAVPVEVKRGSVVYFNGYLLHRSLPNLKKTGFRRALVHHFMSAESLLPWHPPKEGQHMGMMDVRDIVMVAGKDPYAYKGLEDIHKAHVRATGEGGCGDPKKNLKKEEKKD
ncbi:MAG: phytanoyl-CoA dioxygenase family protein [Planctomycetes bacterium]|nr:phytanoyl-CoA dioxygenase family protein [Planctomycetota bacterium]